MSLRIEQLNVAFGKTEVLHEISLDIADGEFVSLLGASEIGRAHV